MNRTTQRQTNICYTFYAMSFQSNIPLILNITRFCWARQYLSTICADTNCVLMFSSETLYCPLNWCPVAKEVNGHQLKHYTLYTRIK